MPQRPPKTGPPGSASALREHEAAAPAQARDTATLALGTLVSRLLGLVRDLLTAHLLGPAADAFVLAFRLPNFFRRLLAEGSLGMAHAAAEARVRAVDGAAGAERFARSVCLRLFLLTLPLCLLLLPLTPALAFMLAPGAEDPVLARGAALLQLCLPYLPLSLAAAVAFAHAASTGRFLPQAWAPALLNIPILLCGFAALALSLRTEAVEIALCLGVACGGLAQASLGLRCFAKPFASNAGGVHAQEAEKSKQSVTPSRGKRGLGERLFGPPPVRALLRTLPASALGAAPHQLHIIAGAFLASFLAPGGISALYFAERLVELPLGLAGAAVGIAALPRFAALAAANDCLALSRSLGRTLRLGAFLSLPATAGLVALARPLSDLLFGHGAYVGDPTGVTAAALRGYALGLPALCAARPLLAAANALKLEKMPLHTALISMAVLALVSVGGMCAGNSPETAALGVGLGLSAAAWCNAALLLRGVCAGRDASEEGMKPSRANRLLRETLRGIWRYAAAAVLMALGLSMLPPLHSLLLIGLIALCAAAWSGLFLALGSEDARAFTALFRRKRI